MKIKLLFNHFVCVFVFFFSLQGDSGGPAQIYHSSVSCMYTIVGVTSFGKVCGTEGVPGVYTRVYSYLDWIENIVWPSASQRI